MSRLVVGITGLALAAGAAAGLATSAIGDSDKKSAQTARTPILSAEGSDLLPNKTASDWVTYSDYVVSATAVDEATEGPDEEDIKAGEGLVGRRITFDVKDVLWSAPEPADKLPDTFQLEGWPSSFTDGQVEKLTPMAQGNVPRLEKGHTYVLALRKYPALCHDKGVTPARWDTLGSDALIPFDDGIVGNGENAGRIQTAEEAKASVRPESPNFSFEDAMVGKDADTLKRELDEAKPGKDAAGDYLPKSTCKVAE